MAKRWRIPEGVELQARATITGILEEQPKPRDIAGPAKSVVIASVQVGPQCFRVVGCGDIAQTIASIPSGTALRIEGTLRRETWKVGQGLVREQTTIDAESVSVLGRSDGKWTPPKS